SSGNFRVLNQTQANYVLGGDQPFEVETANGKGVEFKKFGTIVNVLPAIKPDTDIVDSQLQIELSGPLAAQGALKVRPVATFQLQTEFSAPLGKTVLIVDEPDRRVEVRFEAAK